MPKTKKQRQKQKLYKMKGCSKKKYSKKYLGAKKHLGGNNYNLAYTGKPIFSIPNPNLAYTGKLNTNAENTVYPNTGPIAIAQNWLNSSMQKGGGPSNELQGQSWGPDFKWPGTNHVSGDYNHYALNKYEPVDISRQMIATGAQPPFSGGARKNKKNKSKKQKGGTFSNFLYQDLVNVGRQVQFGLGTAYNGIKGYEAPVSPMPWNQPYLLKSVAKY
jgi:hypothetical protein